MDTTGLRSIKCSILLISNAVWHRGGVRWRRRFPGEDYSSRRLGVAAVTVALRGCRQNCSGSSRTGAGHIPLLRLVQAILPRFRGTLAQLAQSEPCDLRRSTENGGKKCLPV